MIRFFLLLCFWLPMGSGAAPAPAFEDSMAQRVLACTHCHGLQGRAGPDGYYPRLAGKPVGYLYNQLRHFRDGSRHYGPMNSLLEPLSDSYLLDMAEHFSRQDVPYPPNPPGAVNAQRLAHGKHLATQGDPGRKLPACAQCHADNLMGFAPFVPGLLGLPRHYLNAQLGAWRTGTRRAHGPDCMADIATALTADDVAAVVDWLAAQPVMPGAKPATQLPKPMPAQCGATRQSLERGSVPPVSATAPATQAARGEYLARLGNCVHCHTARGGQVLAGGRAIDTPFGRVYSSNISPDVQHGIGRWSSEDFWRALHHGQSPDGRWLVPAFPYTNYTSVTRADSDALFAWLQSQPPASQSNQAHELRWPFGTQWAIWLWRTAYFAPGGFQDTPGKSASWNRGAYLAQGLAHCNACHVTRNALGGPVQVQGISGGLMAPQNWYAPSLVDPQQAGLQAWSVADITRLFREGRTSSSQVSGPMAEVVQHSTSHWNEVDLLALATYLKDLAPVSATATPAASGGPSAGEESRQRLSGGASLYERHCSGCHGQDGKGVPNAYPPLARSRAVNLPAPVNLVQLMLKGGFSATTSGNPRPFGMPPFGTSLSDGEIAAVLTYVRSAWGNNASPVLAQDVDRLRQQKN